VLVERYGDSPEAAIKLADMLAEDQEILAQYLQRPDAREPGASETSGPPAVNSNPERRGTMTHDYKRHGTATMNVLDGTVIGRNKSGTLGG
jgi:hypothetical protein